MVKIVVDSVSGMTKAQAEKLGFGFIPISVIDGNEKYNDGVDIDTKWILKRQEEGAILKTSQPATKVIEDKIFDWSTKHKGVLVITVSSMMSGTYSNVCQVAQNYSNVKVLDSLQAGNAIVVMAKLAAKLLKNNSLDSVLKTLEELRASLFTYLVPHDVNYLARSGRVSPAVAKFAKMVGIIPLMHIGEDGSGQKFDKCRSIKKAISKIHKHAQDKMGKVDEIAILEYGQNKKEKAELKSLVEERFGVKAIFKKVPTSVATHIGPKSFGITISKIK